MKVAGRTEKLGEFPVVARQALAGGGALVLRIGGSDFTVDESTAAAIVELVEQVAGGASVVVTSLSAELTTGQVADLLGVSRPTVVDLVDSGKLPGYKVGTHRRVRAPDALAYRDTHRTDRSAAMDELVAISEDLGLYDD